MILCISMSLRSVTDNKDDPENYSFIFQKLLITKPTNKFIKNIWLKKSRA